MRMIRFGWCRFLVAGFAVCLVANTVISAPVRLAVIAEGASADCRNLADLLQVELSKRDGIEMVEREEIGRVQREQALATSGLVNSADAMNLARILEAKGIVFVGCSEGTNRVYQIRLAETTHGFLAGFVIQTPSGSLEAVVRDVAERLERSLPNLFIPPEQQTCISILHFNNATVAKLKGNPLVDEFLETIEQKLMMELAASPGTLLMERRNLGAIAREGELSGEESSLTPAALLVDGELGVLPDTLDEWGYPMVVLTLRARSTTSDTTRVVREEVGLGGLQAMSFDLLKEFSMEVLRMRDALGPGGLQAEVKILDELVEKDRLPWASDAAFALDPSNRDRCQNYVRLLLDYLPTSKDVRRKAITLARVEQLCRKHDLRLLDAVNWARNSELLVFLSRFETFDSPEIEQLLRPFRVRLLEEFEKQDYRKNEYFFDKHVEWLSGIFKLPSTRRRYLLKRVGELEADPSYPKNIKYFLSVYLLHVYPWKMKFLEEQRGSTNPIRRFYANDLLLKNENSLERQILYTDSMMADLDALLKENTVGFGWNFLHFGSKVAINGVKYRGNHLTAEALADIYKFRPELKELVQRKLFNCIRELTDEQNFQTIEFLDPDIMLDTIPDEELVEWHTQFLSLKDSTGKRLRVHLSEDIVEWRQEILLRKPELENSVMKDSVKVLLSAKEYQAHLATLAKSPDGVGSDIELSPQTLLVDGDTLWIGVSAQRVKRFKPDPPQDCFELFGYIKIDLRTGRVIDESMKWFLAEKRELLKYDSIVDRHGKVFSFILRKPLRVGGYVVTPHLGLGLVAVSCAKSRMDDSMVTGFSSGIPEIIPRTCRFASPSYCFLPLKTGVCLRSGQKVVFCNTETWKVTVLADLRDNASVFGYGNRPKTIKNMVVDSSSGKIFLTLSLDYSDTVVFFRYDTDTGTWAEISEKDMQIPVEESNQQDKAVETLQAANIAELVAVDNWNDKILAIVGWGDDAWRVIQYSRGTNGGEDEK